MKMPFESSIRQVPTTDELTVISNTLLRQVVRWRDVDFEECYSP